MAVSDVAPGVPCAWPARGPLIAKGTPAGEPSPSKRLASLEASAGRFGCQVGHAQNLASSNWVLSLAMDAMIPPWTETYNTPIKYEVLWTLMDRGRLWKRNSQAGNTGSIPVRATTFKYLITKELPVPRPAESPGWIHLVVNWWSSSVALQHSSACSASSAAAVAGCASKKHCNGQR